MTNTPAPRYTAEAHKSFNPDEVHWFVCDRTDDSHHGWFMYAGNAHAAATRMNNGREMYA